MGRSIWMWFLLLLISFSSVQASEKWIGRKFVFEGDSLTSVLSSSDPASKWPTKLQEISYFFRGGLTVNVAHGGDTVANILLYQYDIDVVPQKPTQPDQDFYFFLWAGTNDIKSYHNDATTIYENLKKLWARARSDGFKVVAFPVLWRGDFTPEEQQTRLQLNTLILSNRSLYDYVIRTDLVLYRSYKYFKDEIFVHPNETGNVVIASMVAAAIERGNI